MALLTQQQQEQVAQAIEAVEKTTDAELVTVLARRADHYTYIPILYAAAIALVTPGVMMLASLWRGPWVFWAHGTNLGLWETMRVQWAVFIVCAVLLQWTPLLTRVIPASVKRWRAGNLARRQFLEQNLHHTHAHTGVLIFVSEVERYVEIIADRGIDRHVEQEQWQRIVDAFTAQVRRGEIVQGFLQCVQSCGELLQTHVPATTQKNELPNRMIVLD